MKALAKPARGLEQPTPATRKKASSQYKAYLRRREAERRLAEKAKG